MAKMRRKADLPAKPCAACGLPFTWRKKWARVWDEVRFCSDRCRAARSMSGTSLQEPAHGLKQRGRQ